MTKLRAYLFLETGDRYPRAEYERLFTLGQYAEEVKQASVRCAMIVGRFPPALSPATISGAPTLAGSLPGPPFGR